MMIYSFSNTRISLTINNKFDDTLFVQQQTIVENRQRCFSAI